jgi:hypothetical protein
VTVNEAKLRLATEWVRVLQERGRTSPEELADGVLWAYENPGNARDALRKMGRVS